MLIIFILTTWFLITLFLFKRRHYIAGIGNLIFGLYEFSGIFFYYFSNLIDFSQGQELYEANISSDYVASYMLCVFSVICITNVTYYLFLKSWFFLRITRKIASLKKTSWDVESNYYFLYAFIFSMGLISVVTKAGEAWRSVYDYGTMDVQYMATVNPAHHYGRVLLVIVACLIIRSMIKRNYKILTLQIVSVLPIVYEIFISGRRLSFAPTMLVVLLLLMYSSKIKNRKKIIVSLSGFFLVLFGIQFLLRAEYYEDAYGLDGINLVLRPLVGEFVSVGSSSINAFILITDDMKTYGLHFLTSFLDALPYVKLGGVFSSFFNVKIWDDYLSIAPWGGFSMMADAYLSFGLLGYAVFSVLAAFFLAQSHLYFKYLCDAGVVINRYSIFYFGFIALVILQYRVGIVDSARTLVAFVSLYLFAVVFPVYVKQWLRSRVVFMKSVPE